MLNKKTEKNIKKHKENKKKFKNDRDDKTEYVELNLTITISIDAIKRL